MSISFQTTLAELADTLKASDSLGPEIDRTGDLIIEGLRQGRKVLSCGNGGSAADALHLAEELIGRYRGDRKSLPGLSLTADVTAMTCIANDYGYEAIFSRQIEGLAAEGDILVAFTTSGNSANIVKAMEAARKKEMLVILLSGPDGGLCKSLAEHAILIPSANGARIQEMHTLVLHHWLEKIENEAW